MLKSTLTLESWSSGENARRISGKGRRKFSKHGGAGAGAEAQEANLGLTSQDGEGMALKTGWETRGGVTSTAVFPKKQ